MAIRPVFMACDKPPYVRSVDIEFKYSSGFAVSQKQKNIMTLHSEFKKLYEDMNVLEISSKSLQSEGIALSAFNLLKYVPSLGKSVPVENAFQAGKVFECGGPYTDLLTVSPREAKRDERLRNSGRIIKFVFEGQEFPTKPLTEFYDYIYISALEENSELAEKVMHYDAFTDIEFNPNKSINCQAKAAARFVGQRRRIID